jgi:hypothetical protein
VGKNEVGVGVRRNNHDGTKHDIENKREKKEESRLEKKVEVRQKNETRFKWEKAITYFKEEF